MCQLYHICPPRSIESLPQRENPTASGGVLRAPVGRHRCRQAAWVAGSLKEICVYHAARAALRDVL
jgi:hypothetical protein